jgi:predicted DNA binding protein
MFAGLDIGRADDYTVLSIINQDGQMVTAHRWRHDEWTRIIDKVAELIKQYNAVTLVEVNNQGDVFFEMLQSRCRNLIHPFVTSSKTKPIIIEDLAVAFEQKAISIINEQWLLDELDNFSYIYNPNTRNVSYSAPAGLHDDGVMSTALAWNSRKEFTNKGRYMALRV